MSLKVAFDGQLLLTGNKTGIAWNAHNLILQLARNPEVECTINIFGKGLKAEQLNYLKEYEDAGCQVEICKWMNHSLYKILWNIIPLHYGFLFKNDTDITQFFNFTVPPGVRGKAVTIIHDMAYKACPETLRRKTLFWLKMSMKHTVKNADHIVTVSDFSKSEIIKYLGVSEDLISVVPNAADNLRYNADIAQERVESAKERYKIKGDYILYLGTIEPRKNLERLIEAYDLFAANAGSSAPLLVLAGGKGWMSDPIYDRVSRSPYKDRILFTGYIDKDDAAPLMKGAEMFVFPSLYEGFGMPPLEAMACGCPVVVSDTSSLPEVVGEAGIKVDCNNAKQISEVIGDLHRSSELRSELTEKGLQRVKEFDWKDSANRLLAMYKDIL